MLSGVYSLMLAVSPNVSAATLIASSYKVLLVAFSALMASELALLHLIDSPKMVLSNATGRLPWSWPAPF